MPCLTVFVGTPLAWIFISVWMQLTIVDGQSTISHKSHRHHLGDSIRTVELSTVGYNVQDGHNKDGHWENSEVSSNSGSYSRNDWQEVSYLSKAEAKEEETGLLHDKNADYLEDFYDPNTTESYDSSGADELNDYDETVNNKMPPSAISYDGILKDENYLKLDFNPEIQVSIEVLHDKSETAVQSTVKPVDDTFDTLTTMASNSKTSITSKSTRTNSSASKKYKNVNLLPTVVKSIDSDIRRKENANTGLDVCESWIHCPGELLLSEIARFGELPNCPCTYSFDIHYKDEIWDNKKQRYFRWRDASGPNDHLDIYRPTAKWCIRSLISDGSRGMAAQQCCYDHQRHLISRGAGAGTPSAVSPEVSRELHHKVDVIPWIMCHGDWTRYHTRRSPNNGFNCKQNPEEKVYLMQVYKAKHYK